MKLKKYYLKSSSLPNHTIRKVGSGALSGKMLLVRIVEDDKIDDYLGQVRLSKS